MLGYPVLVAFFQYPHRLYAAIRRAAAPFSAARLLDEKAAIQSASHVDQGGNKNESNDEFLHARSTTFYSQPFRSASWYACWK